MAELRVPVRDAAGAAVAEVVIRDVSGRHFVERTTFINSFSQEVSATEASAIRELALGNDWAALNDYDPEFLPWFCRACARNYPEHQWKVFPQFDEDHWLDSYRGICPYGHERMIAD